MEETPKTDPFGDGVTEETKKIARDNALKFGLYLGGISILMQLALYFVNPLIVVTTPAVVYGILIISIALDVYFILEFRKAIGGHWNFRLAFSSIFLMLLISAICSQIYQVVLYKVIDKELPQKITDASLEKARNDMAARGLSSEQIESSMTMVKKWIPEQGSISTILMGLVVSAIFSIIFALIFAAIFKKEKPIFSTSA